MGKANGDGGETVVYRCFDEEGRLLYVGVSYSIFLRLGQHNDRAPWMHYAVTIKLERFPTREAAEAAEAAAILGEDPVWNQDGRPARRFMQWMAAYPSGNPDDVDVDALIERARQLIGTNANPYNQGETHP